MRPNMPGVRPSRRDGPRADLPPNLPPAAVRLAVGALGARDTTPASSRSRRRAATGGSRRSARCTSCRRAESDVSTDARCRPRHVPSRQTRPQRTTASAAHRRRAACGPPPGRRDRRTDAASCARLGDETRRRRSGFSSVVQLGQTTCSQSTSYVWFHIFILRRHLY